MSVEHTNQMLPNGITRCWDLKKINGKLIMVMTEVPSMEIYRGNGTNHCFNPGDPDDDRDSRGREIKKV